jgi:hypothetical protein
MQKMKRAWVITQEGLRYPMEVVGILSARKHADAVKEFVEWLYLLPHCGAGTHLESAKYRKPLKLHPAELWTTNTGAPMDTLMRCGDHPWLVARRASQVILDDTDDEHPTLTWTNPHRLVCDPATLQIIEKVAGGKHQAPIRLPLSGRTPMGCKP